MNPSDYFRKAVEHLLDEKQMKQLELAKRMKEKPTSINDFIRGRRNFSEKRKEKIAQILGTTYVEMLLLGRELADKENPPAPKKLSGLPHQAIIEQFQDKETARRINHMLVELERTDADKYQEVVEYISWKHGSIKKTKRAGNG